MPLKEGDEVQLLLSRDEQVSGEVVSTDFPDVFSDGWRVQAVITEGGHPNYGQLALFHTSEVILVDQEGAEA